MLLKHFFVEKIAHSSYILAGTDSCAVIDPQRDVDIYIKEARAHGVKITHILQTHLPADKDILLVAEDYQKALEANRWARRVGVDRIVGYLDGGLPGWAVAGLPSRAVRQLSAKDLHDRL